MSGSIQVLHTADTHLGYRPYGSVERENDIYEAFTETIEIALREHVDVYVVAGDVFNSPSPPPQAIRVAYTQLRRLTDKGIPVVAVMGDHDVPRRRHLPALILLRDLVGDRFYLLGSVPEKSLDDAKAIVSTRSGPLYVAGLRNVKGASARSQLRMLLRMLSKPPNDKPSMLVLHQGLREAVGPEYELELGELPRGYSYYALGHVHVTRVYQLGESRVVYPGSIEALRRDEARQQGERYAVLAELNAGGSRAELVKLRRPRPQPVVEIQFVDMDKLRSELASLAIKIEKLARESGKKPVLHITIRGVPGARKREVLRVLQHTLSERVLLLRPEIVGAEEEATIKMLDRDPRSAGRVSPYTALLQVLGDEELAAFAEELVERLAAPSEREAIQEAKRLVEEKFNLKG
ncbi:MAG: exonuclease SbcCD subunit D [Crenarchaeota archaeon]|nr:exonuclease SbcCD subunit D [Thermoproteota archaeon]